MDNIEIELVSDGEVVETTKTHYMEFTTDYGWSVSTDIDIPDEVDEIRIAVPNAEARSA